MRLIDADALLKVFGFTEDCIKCEHRYNDVLCESAIWRDVCDAIFETPTIDAVPVVRCRDCKFWQKTPSDILVRKCNVRSGYSGDTDFCSYGERKDND